MSSGPPPFPGFTRTSSNEAAALARTASTGSTPGDSSRRGSMHTTTLARSASTIPHAPEKTLQLTLQASNLPSYDLFSPSDAFCILYEKNTNGLGRHISSSDLQHFVRLGTTEIIMDVASPTWTRPIVFQTTSQEPQQYRLEVYDADEPDVNDLSGQDFIGAVEFTLKSFYDIAHDISGVGSGVSFENPTYISTQHFELLDKKNHVVQAKNLPAARLTVTLHEKPINQAKSLASVEIKTKKADKYLVQFCAVEKLNNSHISHHKSIQSDRETVIYETPVSSNGSFPPFIIDEDSLYQHHVIPKDELDTHAFVVKLIKFKSKMDMKCVGTIRWTLDEAISGAINVQKTFLGPKGEDAGQLVIKNWITYKQPPTFEDYVAAGLQFEFHYAVDLSGSKGHHCLHAINASGKNIYTTAMREISSCYAQWFEDPLFQSGQNVGTFHAYAFGGSAADKHAVSKHKPYALSPDDEFEFKRIDDMTGLYLTHVLKVNESIHQAPFGPFLQSVNETIIVKEDMKLQDNDMMIKNMTYHVLVIFTDGGIDNWNECITAISEMCHKPISIVFVGIGADRTTVFPQLSKLDTFTRNQELLLVENNKAFPFVERNMTTFIPYVQSSLSMGYLSEKLISNLKREVVQHYITARKMPNKD